MQGSDIEYVHNGRRYLGYMAVPDGADVRAGVLIAHEGFGLDDHAKQRATRLAELGYVAFALDYYGDGQPVPPAEARERLAPLRSSPELARALAQAGLAVLLAEPRVDPKRIAAIGYCFGGTLMLELARGGADLKAIVGFHSGLATTQPGDAAAITAKVLVCIGADDPLIPPEQRADFEAEMRAGNVDWRMNLLGGAVHSFTNPNADQHRVDAIKYHAPSDRRSWNAMLDLFAETIDITAT
jgi:dienelactone hydrolase